MRLSDAVFIVFEGADGAGKSTQVRVLLSCLKRLGIKHKFVHFPQYKKKPYGELISRYLRGEFGKADEVNPYFASLLYAGDRQVFTKTLINWLDSGYIVISDRYILSNLAFQRAKIKDDLEKARFTRWIQDFEFNFNKILRPDLTIFLDASDEFILSRLSNDRGFRAYLKDSKDIHESDLDYQKRVIHEYRQLSASKRDVLYINCCNKEGMMMSVEEIHKIIVNGLKKRFPKHFSRL